MAGGITSLTIEGYRALQHLSLEGLGRVNLLTGRNNTGKSSVLEALRLLASTGAPRVVYDILRAREEAAALTEDAGPHGGADGLFELSSLFSGFPPASTGGGLLLTADCVGGLLRLSLTVGRFPYGAGRGRRSRDPGQAALPGLDPTSEERQHGYAPGGELSLVVETQAD